MLELRSKPPSLTFLIRKVSKRISHRIHHFIFAKLLSFQRTFHEKSFVSGFWADSPNIQCTQKARQCRAFIFLPQIFRILSVCLYLTYKFAERFGVRHVRHAFPNGIRRYDLNIAFISVYKCLYGVGNKKFAF